MNKVRIGFLGVGKMGQMAHLRNYVNIDDCEVVAIAEIRPELGKLVAERYGIEKVYNDHNAMFAAEKLDGVVASQKFELHANLLPEVYSRVKHVFTEKPIAVAPSAGQALAEAAAKTGCVHMVGYHKRSDPAVMYAKRIIDDWKASGKMGPMKYVRLTMPEGDWIANGFIGLLSSDDPLPELALETPSTDLPEDLYSPYRNFVNYYIHQINLMRHLLCESYDVTYADPSGVLLAGQSKSGVACMIEMSPYKTTLEWEESALVAFQHGYIRISLPAPVAYNRPGSVEIYEDPGNGATPLRTTPTLPWVHAMHQQAINFVKVCKGEIAPPCDAAEAVEDLHVAMDYIRMRLGRQREKRETRLCHRPGSELRYVRKKEFIDG
ncbi:MAG: Gfo/Idh/MocA family oxidoreductase [Phycisphaerae bacterium]|nr:Gfo/Idh/MocA family oxidoreductase [Phycisphaerae bacterium]